MKYETRAFWLVATSTVLLFAFQNCGGASYDSSDLLYQEPLASLNSDVENTKYKGGQAFSLLSNQSSLKTTEFQVSKAEDGAYNLLDKEKVSVCNLEESGSLEELMNLSDSLKITHPTLTDGFPEVCSSAATEGKHIKLGDQSAIYLVAKSADLGCLLDDPIKLLDEGKRAFIIDNISHDEIQALIDEAKSLRDSSSDCSSKDRVTVE